MRGVSTSLDTNGGVGGAGCAAATVWQDMQRHGPVGPVQDHDGNGAPQSVQVADFHV
ncbi:hypothetical protein [Novosphingobium sp.]|uniref:hypothetical protein n=1 Tax=Novosphingobium sp. TaxID=1874826 RepID=UPI00260AFC5B|nr:hypothetical protein [Novosphingobium sp.]